MWINYSLDVDDFPLLLPGPKGQSPALARPSAAWGGNLSRKQITPGT
jgi:hypothetical protein